MVVAWQQRNMHIPWRSLRTSRDVSVRTTHSLHNNYRHSLRGGRLVIVTVAPHGECSHKRKSHGRSMSFRPTPCIPYHSALQSFSNSAGKKTLPGSSVTQYVRNKEIAVTTGVQHIPQPKCHPWPLQGYNRRQPTRCSDATSTCTQSTIHTRRPPGRTCCRWIDQIQKENNDTPVA